MNKQKQPICKLSCCFHSKLPPSFLRRGSLEPSKGRRPALGYSIVAFESSDRPMTCCVTAGICLFHSIVAFMCMLCFVMYIYIYIYIYICMYISLHISHVGFRCFEEEAARVAEAQAGCRWSEIYIYCITVMYIYIYIHIHLSLSLSIHIYIYIYN